MAEERDIPEELLNFFSDEYGKSIVIKGKPGTGKTIFALTLLSILRGNGIYLSTRVDPEMLYETCPWIKGEISKENVLDATQSERPAARRRVTTIKPLKYTDVPEFLREVYERTENMKNPIVIIDSWDAVATHTGYYEPRDREKLEHNLCDFARKTGTKMIFIVEYTEQKPLDYLVDGVVITENIVSDDRILRKMFIQKLRGCEIRNPFSLFTLKGGKFKAFKFESLRQKLRNLQEAVSAPPIEDLSERRISTGVPALDEVLGGYGHLNMLKGDFLAARMLSQVAALNALNLGRRVIVAEERAEMIDEIMPFVSEANRDKVKAVREFNKEMDENTLLLMDIADIGMKIGDFASVLRSRKCFALCYASKTDAEAEKVASAVASVVLQTSQFAGVPCVCGETPRTGFFALEWEVSAGFPALKATPIE